MYSPARPTALRRVLFSESHSSEPALMRRFAAVTPSSGISVCISARLQVGFDSIR